MFTFIAALSCVGALPDDVSLTDSPLHAVRFVDRREGWAAGADGIVLHSIDGGTTWERQAVPTKGSLRSLQFLTPYTGFAVGREEVQATGGSAGVLLGTRDGGLSWSRLAHGVLPGLQAVTFFDESVGLVAGDGTDRTPSGLYRTADAGRTWQAVPAPRGGAWLAASAADRNTIALAGSWSRAGVLRAGDYSPADVDPLSGRHIRAIATHGSRAVAVGQGGLVLLSADSTGGRYGFADLGVPADQLANFDFRGVATVGDHIWIVGCPGTIVFHSRDAGKTWERQTTGQNMPLNAVQFLDADHGWAVGELGVALATTDGGRSWTPTRRGGQRSAVLCIHAFGKSVPLDLMASLGADAGYLVAALEVTAADPNTAATARSSESMRLETAVRKSGGAAAASLAGFSMPTHLESAAREVLIAHWDKSNSNQATERLIAQLALAIRIWQPEVIVTDFAGSAAESIVVEAVQTAFTRAADAAAFPEHLGLCKLAAWQSKKLYTLWDGPGQPHVTVATSDTSASLHDTPRDYANRVIGLISDKSLPKTRGLRLLANTLPAGQGKNGVMDGITLAPGGTGRRAVHVAAAVNNAIDKPLRELRTMLNLTQSGLPQLGDPGVTLARMGTLLDQLPAEHAARAANNVAEQFAKSGQWALAREAYALVAERYPGQSPAVDACRWLVRYHSSSEARRRYELGQYINIAQTEFRASDSAPTKENPFRPGGGVRGLSDTDKSENRILINDPSGARQWYQAAVALEPKLAAQGPLVASDPCVRFCMHAAKRQLGEPDPARAWLRTFLAEQAGTPGSDPWRDVARMELWLLERQNAPPRPTAACRFANQRPHLDAKFDDACWADSVPIAIKLVSGDVGPEYATTARFSHDAEFFYLAIECKHPADGAKPAVEKRTRDADLTPFDRVEILLDMDRDYQTCYRFRIDSRGALAEDCWGDPSWNPRWYVAFQSDAEGYSAEIAITLADLTGDVLPSGRAWAANVVRIVPGRGISAWSQPADATPRGEGCGVLVFTGAK